MYFCQNQICYCTNIYRLHCTIVLLVWATCIWHVCKLYLISQPSAAPYLINPTGQRHWISWQRSWEGLFWWNSQEVQWWRSFAGSKPCVNDCGFHGQDLMVDICYIYLGTVFRDSKHITIYIYIYISIFAFGFPSGKCLGKYRVVDWWVCIYNIAVALPRHRFTSARGGWPTMVLSARRGRRHLATQNIFTGCVAESLQPPSGPNAPSRLLWKPNLVASKGARISDLLSILAACHTMENLSIEFIVRCMGYI